MTMTSAPIIRPAVIEDAAVCADIFSHYVLHTCANLQSEPLPASYFAELIKKANLAAPFLVAEDGGAKDDRAVCGYAYADIFRSRCGYRFTAEISIYIAQDSVGRGLGGMLMTSLLDELRRSDMRNVISLITMPNPHSVKLHEKHGFVSCGLMPGVGWKFDAQHDVGMWLLQLR